MAYQIEPIFALNPYSKLGSKLTGANTAYDGTGSNFVSIITATKQTLVNGIWIRSLGSNSAEAVLRIYWALTATMTTAADNSLIDEVELPITVSSNTRRLPSFIWRPSQQLVLKNGETIRAALSVACTAGWMLTPSAFTQET